MTQREKADALRRLHRGPRILPIANVWDAASARIVERAGLSAVGTSSAGVAFALGWPDGEAVPLEELLAQVRRIVRVSALPVTVDMEAGYGDIERAVHGLLDAGAAGLNLEDFQRGTLLEAGAQVQRIELVRRLGERRGVPLVINARTDIYLEQIGPVETRFRRTVERLAAYRDAGADCLFVPGVRDEETIGELVTELRFPLNILAGQGSPAVGRLEELGVARVSLGSGPMRATMALLRGMVEELRDEGTYGLMLRKTIPYADANELMR